jgi:hypothetical protein
MKLFDVDAFQEAVNRDGEFQIAGRFLDGALKLHFGDEALLLRFRDGKVAGIIEPTLFDSADITIRGPVANWREFLKPLPKPFFHDMFAAIVRNEFDWAGNSETFFAYYGAFRRMFQIMREHAKN